MKKDNFIKPTADSADTSAIPRAACGEHGNRKGATPSNTAPSNCNGDSFIPVRFGVDSLYLSHKGELLKEPAACLEVLKEAAQSDDKQHLAQLEVHGHCFAVRDKGRKGFDYVLQDNCFDIGLSATASRRPVAYTQVSSSCLACVKLKDVYTKLFEILNKICYLEDAGTVSRVDLFMDFCVEDDFIQQLSSDQVIRNVKVMRPYIGRNGQIIGYDFGLGGDLSCRLYNKTLQIAEVGGQEHLPLLWSKAGWVEGETVWRLEFQLRRSPLAEFGITTIWDLQERLEALWKYLTNEWLRVVLPNPNDKTRSRWQTHPVWVCISEAFMSEDAQVRLKRIKKDRAPDESNILLNLASSIISWMAIHNHTDVKEGLKALLNKLPDLLWHTQTRKGVRLTDHIEREVPKRIRLFNLRRNDDDLYSISNFNALKGGYDD